MPRSSRKARISLAIAVRSLTRRERTPVQGLQVGVFGGLGGDEAHGRALHRFGDGFRIAVVVFVALEESLYIFGGHESGVVAEGFEPAAQVMGAGTGPPAEEAGREVGNPGFELAAGELLAQNDGAALVEADEVVFLPMSMPRVATVSLDWRGMGRAHCLGQPPA